MSAQRANALMVLGTHSNAGKSLMATAFCRILARRGIAVAPFKAQNMSNNAGVTFAGGEMGRAQLVQAEAAGVPPHTDMNPILLKPEAALSGLPRSQIVLNGKVYGYINAANWADIKRLLWDEVRAAYDRLAGQYEVIIMEGAGSPAEINLKAGDIVNLRMASHANAACLLVGDIDRGGVFAALAGTIFLLDEEERTQIKGFLINKFRGDPTLLGDINSWFQDKAFGVPTFGIIPHLPDLQIADEDAVVLDRPICNRTSRSTASIDIAIISFPHIANFDEFDALTMEESVQVRYVRAASEIGQSDVIILPGTKSTIADLRWLREQRISDAINTAYRAGATVIGICGGYQMLGQVLSDPLGIEGAPGDQCSGLGLLPVQTVFQQRKETNQSLMRLADGMVVRGYEIHSGLTTRLADTPRHGEIIERNGVAVQIADGARSADGRVWGCYLHGIFENDEFRYSWLQALGWRGRIQSKAALRRQEYDRLADAVEAAIGWPQIAALCGLT